MASDRLVSRYFEPPPPRVVAHRGYSARYPENTLPAFAAAAPLTSHFELDVWWSADGVLVVHHDETLQRTCGDPRPIYTVPWPELAQLDAGRNFLSPPGMETNSAPASIPTLENLFRAFPEHHYIVEIKHNTPGIEEAVVSLAQACGVAERILIASEHDAVVARARAAAPEIPTNLGAGEVARFVRWLLAGRPGTFSCPARALQIPPSAQGVAFDTPELIAAAHELGWEVHYWTINEPADMRRLLQYGADAIITDEPALAARLLAPPDSPA